MLYSDLVPSEAFSRKCLRCRDTSTENVRTKTMWGYSLSVWGGLVAFQSCFPPLCDGRCVYACLHCLSSTLACGSNDTHAHACGQVMPERSLLTASNCCSCHIAGTYLPNRIVPLSFSFLVWPLLTVQSIISCSLSFPCTIFSLLKSEKLGW